MSVEWELGVAYIFLHFHWTDDGNNNMYGTAEYLKFKELFYFKQLVIFHLISMSILCNHNQNVLQYGLLEL